ncbi:MAG: hypothetical protein KTR30_23620 [Saprospiraceae bacterium]|nr:hypothetical protein [Saprospiraceae bacterium]
MAYLYDQPFKLYQNIYLSQLDFRPLKSIILEWDTLDLLFNNDDELLDEAVLSVFFRPRRF